MACLASKSKLIFISSREVYGETISDLTTEDDPLSPNNLYGMTKLLGENLVKWAASKYDLDYTILRLTNVYGPGGDQYGIQIMIKKALAQEEILVLGGKQTVNLLYVDDAVEAIRLCLLDSRSSRQAFNVGSFDNITLDAALSEIASLFGDTLKLRHKPMRDGETFRFAPSLEKIEKTLGYRPATGLTMGLENTVRWYRKHAAIRASV
jgi:UDP-glucose 4-epimerase